MLKVERGDVQTNSKGEMRLAKGGNSWIPVAFVLLVIAIVWLAVPVSPSVSVFVRISTSTTSYGALSVSLDSFSNSYQKVPLSATSISSKNAITLNPLTASQGTYVLSIGVSYGNQILNNQTFVPVGDGTYQARITLWTSWQENSSTPYIFSFALSTGTGTSLATLNVAVYPT